MARLRRTDQQRWKKKRFEVGGFSRYSPEILVLVLALVELFGGNPFGKSLDYFVVRSQSAKDEGEESWLRFRGAGW